MASPQTDKGYTRIANEILTEIMKANLNGTQFRILLVLWRFTYGFQKTQKEMSLAFIADHIDANRAQVNRELTALIDRKFITVAGVGSKGARELKFNKNYEKWINRAIGKEDPAPKPKRTAKAKKAKKEKYSEDNTYYKMAVYFLELVKEVAEEAGVEHLIAKVNLQTWAEDFRKLIELDKVDKYLAKDVMDWVTKDSFWKTNVLSAKKLREKFTDLAIKMKSQNAPKPGQNPLPQRDIRDKEIEFQNWVQEGNDPSEFNWRN